MDATHVHLALTHVPIVGTVIGTLILAYSIVKNNKAVSQVALFTLLVMAFISAPVFLTGEEAEESIEHLPGVEEHYIHEHEELAEKAIWLMVILGVFAAFTLYAVNAELAIAQKATIITCVIGIATFVAFVQVGNLGGEIRHTEIRCSESIIDDHHEHDH